MGQKAQMTPGDRVKILREKRGLSQEDLEKLSGIRRTQLSAYENNRIGIGSRTAKKISAALGVSPQFILFGDDKEAIKVLDVYAQINPESRLTEEEKRLLNGWRNLQSRDQIFIDDMIKQIKKRDSHSPSPHGEVKKTGHNRR